MRNALFTVSFFVKFNNNRNNKWKKHLPFDADVI